MITNLLNPRRCNIKLLATIIDKKFVKKSKNAPIAICQLPTERHVPTTASGGTKEMAIAAPGNESLISSLLIANAATAPDASAINKSVTFGLVLEIICEFVSNEMNPMKVFDKNHAITITVVVPAVTVRNDFKTF